MNIYVDVLMYICIYIMCVNMVNEFLNFFNKNDMVL